VGIRRSPVGGQVTIVRGGQVAEGSRARGQEEGDDRLSYCSSCDHQFVREEGD
jgi:hypothetical protein